MVLKLLLNIKELMMIYILNYKVLLLPNEEPDVTVMEIASIKPFADGGMSSNH